MDRPTTSTRVLPTLAFLQVDVDPTALATRVSNYDRYATVAWWVLGVIVVFIAFEWVSDFWLTSKFVERWRLAAAFCRSAATRLRRKKSLHVQAKKLEHEIYQFYRDADDKES